MSFVQQALRCFQHQDWPDAELIVVDDGESSCEHLCDRVPRVRYIRLGRPTTTGTKLNIGIEHAHGDIVQKFDDDDFYGPRFLSHAAEPFASGRANPERTLVAWDCFLVLVAGDPVVRFSGHGWTTGGTFCFHRALWRRQPFRDVPRAVDHWFLADNEPDVIRVCEAESYMVVRHGRNTWTLMQGGEKADDYLRRRRPHSRPLAEVVGEEHYSFYRGIVGS